MEAIQKPTRGRGKPPRGISLVSIPMHKLMAHLNASANVTCGRVWLENMGILKKGAYEETDDVNAWFE